MPKLPKKPPAPTPISTGYWLMKSEPDVFSWDMLVERGAKGEPWTGVRNYLARNNMRAMAIGDLGFFYHSNIGKEIIGILRVIATAHRDADDETGTWECVDVAAHTPLPKPVTLAGIKDDPALAKMPLVTTSRLSVQPVTWDEWAYICKLGGLDACPRAGVVVAKVKPRAAKKARA